MHAFRLYNPLPLKVVLRRIVKENYWVEKQMHRSLAQYAVGREWFDCPAELVRTAFDEALKELIASRQAIVGSARGWVDNRASF
jgi:hypothetical protein